MRHSVLVLLALALFGGSAMGQNSSPTAAERLASLINGYRAEHGLPAVPVSNDLTEVAKAHVADSGRSSPPPNCNPHSWGPGGNWKSCCFTDKRTESNDQCMWRKPSEITGGRYKGNGFEISHWGHAVTPESALNGWMKSEGHNNVILNRKDWQRNTWRAMGVAISDRYAHVWFGEDADPQTPADWISQPSVRKDSAAPTEAQGTNAGRRPESLAVDTPGFDPGGHYYRLQSRFLQGQNKCLDGNRPGRDAFLGGAVYHDDCDNVSGQQWKFVRAGNGYFRLQTLFQEKNNMCLEGGLGAAERSPVVQQPCANASGQLWKVVPAGDGYFRLQTLFLEKKNMCLEGGGGAAKRSPASQQPCQDVTGQYWRFLPS